MARFQCAADDGESAGYLITDLATDETVAMCPAHMAGWSAAYVEAFAAANAPADEQPELTPEPEPADTMESPVPEPEPAPRRRKPRPTGTAS